jgi:fructose-bisphosphate aldolase class 1
VTDAERSNASLEREMEQTRERLATTIDQLVNRANPKNAVDRRVAGVKAVFVDANGDPRTDNVLKVVGGVFGFVGLLVLIRRVTS